MTRINADWLTAPTTQRVLSLLTDAGHQAFVVGGCVRNELLGVPASDIDVSTSARPDAVKSLATKAGVKCVPTGLDHGTVTLVVDGQPFEVTTFRRDVETDGRRAVVAFSDTMEEDAARRDFTMNALYADASGAVFDPVSGLPDLKARSVRFIGDAEARIREDYLRSLRYFRFHAHYGDPVGGIDVDALAAIAGNLDGVERLSCERVGAEMVKLLAAPDPSPSLASMSICGLLMRVLPGADATRLALVVHAEKRLGLSPDPIARLSALGGDDVSERLRLSKKAADRLERLRDAASGTAGAAELGFRLGQADALRALTARSALFETEPDDTAKSEVERGAMQTFPLKAKDLMPKLSGAALGAALNTAERAWIDSDFTFQKEALVALALKEG